VIESFRCKETEKIWNREFSKKFPHIIQSRARRKLISLQVADSLNDLMVPPSNHLEQLKGDRAGQKSIRINQQWRICFEWKNGNACSVEIVDYH
jgi:toxin HigB-1